MLSIASKAQCSLVFTVALLTAACMGTVQTEFGRRSKAARLSEMIQLGSRWHTYLEATASDAVIFLWKNTTVIRAPEQVYQTLLDVWTRFPLAVGRTNPCKEKSFRTFTDIVYSASIFSASLRTAFWNESLPTEYDMYLFQEKPLIGNELEYNLPTLSSVCGLITAVFIIPEFRQHALYAYSWHISVAIGFKINVTITEMSVKYLPFCTTMYAAISDVMKNGRFALLGIHCPNYPIRSFYSSSRVARVALFTPQPSQQLHVDSMLEDDSFGDFTFLYQLHDNDFFIGSRTLWEILYVKDLEAGMHLGQLLMKQSEAKGLSGSLYNRTSFGKQNKLTWKHELSIFQTVSAGMLYIQAPLGDTVLVTFERFTCLSAIHSMRFYDGPPVDLLEIDVLQRLLMLWDCSPTDVTDSDTSYCHVHASIGDLTIIMISNTTIINFAKVTFDMRWTSATPNDGTIKLDTIEIEATESRPKTFSAEGMPSFLSVTEVRAPRPLSVKITLEALQYRGHALQQCQSGGLFLFSDNRYNGGICSDMTAAYLMEHYAQHGIVMGSKIHIIIKQYSYMSQIKANLIFSAVTCVGYLNLLPTGRFALGKLYKLNALNVRRSRVYYDFPYYNGIMLNFITDPNLWHTLHVTRLSPSCVTIQLSPLDHLPADVYYHQQNKYMAMLHFASAGKSTYSRASFRYISKEDISLFANCRRFFRVDLDTELDHMELSATLSNNNNTNTTAPMQGEAYNIKVGIANRCMNLYVSFIIHIEDATPRSTCVNEAGGFLHDAYHPVLLPGVCGDVLLTVVQRDGKAFPNVILSFQKPYTQHSCCYFDVTIGSNKTGCSNFIEVRKRFPEAKDKVYSVGVWYTKNHTLFHRDFVMDNNTVDIFALQVDCQILLPYDSMAFSGVETCTEIDIYLDSYPCEDVKVEFHAQLFPLHQQGLIGYEEEQPSVCIDSTCYTTGSMLQSRSWVEADQACQQRGGVLASINSEEEWNILTRPHVTENGTSSLVQALEAQLYYIGLHVKNGNNVKWIDNSVYAFEAWHAQAPYLIPFSRLIKDRVGNLITILTNTTWLDFQPNFDSNSNCTAIWTIDSMILQWITLPCEQVNQRASYICEFRNNQTAKSIHSTRFYSHNVRRNVLECPPNTTYIAMLCVTVRTMESSNFDVKTLPKNCGQQSKPFQLPGVVNSQWQESNTHFIETVRLFYRRWPSMYDYGSIVNDWLDEILMIEIDINGESETAAIHFSKSGNFNLRVARFNKSFPGIDTSVFNILCGVVPSLANTICATGHFQCTEGTCILEHYVCDGRADCPDLSDEADCSAVCSLYDVLSLAGKDCYSACMPGICTCHQLYFQCQYGGCVPWSRVCDGSTECPHGEDEVLCLFYQDDDFGSNVVITQKTGVPVVTSASSNQENILSDNRERSAYKNLNVLTTPGPEYENFVLSGSSLHYFVGAHLCAQPDETTCLKNFYGDCFPRHRLCIYEHAMEGLGCRDGAHLKSCYLHSCPNFFKCPKDYCLPFHLVCNGVPDCPNGQDEEQCERMSCPGFLLCSLEQICVHPHDLWTNHTKCFRSQDDQALVGSTNCPAECECLGQAVTCNGIESFSSFQTSKYSRLIIMEGTTIAQNTFRWTDVTSDFLIALKVCGCDLTSDNVNELIATQFLKHLNLSNNIIDRLDSRLFRDMKNLESLDVSRNLLQFLGFDVFSAAQKLEDLIASYNRIGEINCDSSNNSGHLKRLILNNNHMRSLHSVVKCQSMFSKLREINVSYNRLDEVDHYSLFQPLRSLTVLDTSPLSLCCFLSDVPHCRPSSDAKNTLCKSLMPSVFLRGVYWSMGIFLLLNTSICIVYLQFQLRKKTKKLPVWLTISLLLSHWTLGFYFFGLAVADTFFSPYYSIYEHLWRQSVMCKIFDMLSLTSFLQSLLESFLLSVLQMISVVMPFHVSGMHEKPFYIASVLWAGGTLVAGGLGSTITTTRDGVQGAVESGVCLNLLWPGNPRLGWVVGTLVAPELIIIVAFVLNQLVIMYSIGKSGMASTEASQARRSRVRGRAFCCLVVQILGTLPLLISHILTMIGFSVSDLALLYVGIGILVINPVANPFLHVYSSSAFIGELTSLKK